MLRTNERESEILLGNKQLLGIFFAVALLLGVAFYGGYMVGRKSSGTKASAGTETATTTTAAPSSQNVSAGETHTIPGESGSTGDESSSPSERSPVIKSNPGSHELAGSAATDVPLGSRKSKTAHETKTVVPAVPDLPPAGSYTPQPGSQYLQVVALGRSEAEGLADVLHKKGFRAHAVPKPGTSLYRVIVGPIHDPGDLSTTRDALRKTGFREVIVQRY
jgi:cell division septation protein DedD